MSHFVQFSNFLKEEFGIEIEKQAPRQRSPNLVPKKVQVRRGGKTFERTQMVRPAEVVKPKMGTVDHYKEWARKGGYARPHDSRVLREYAEEYKLNHEEYNKVAEAMGLSSRMYPPPINVFGKNRQTLDGTASKTQRRMGVPRLFQG